MNRISAALAKEEGVIVFTINNGHVYQYRSFEGKGVCRPAQKIKKPARGWLYVNSDGLFQTGSITQQLRFIGFFPREMFATEVTVSGRLFINRMQEIQHLDQAIRTQVEELAYQ